MVSQDDLASWFCRILQTILRVRFLTRLVALSEWSALLDRAPPSFSYIPLPRRKRLDKCVVENDCMWQSLVKLQSFPLSELQIAPIYRILKVSKSCVTERSLAWSSRSGVSSTSLSSSIGFVIVKNTDCLPLMRLRHPLLICGICFICIPDVVDVLSKSFWVTVQWLATQDQQHYLLNVLELLWGAGSGWKSLNSSNIDTFSCLLLLFARIDIQSLSGHCEAPSNFFFLHSSKTSSK